MKRDHKGVSGKPGKWVYITPSEFDVVQVKFIRVETVKYKNDPQRYFRKIKKFPKKKNFPKKNFFFCKLFPSPIIFTPTNCIPWKLGKICFKIWQILKPHNFVIFCLILVIFFCWNQHLLVSTEQLITPFPLVVTFHWRGHIFQFKSRTWRIVSIHIKLNFLYSSVDFSNGRSRMTWSNTKPNSRINRIMQKTTTIESKTNCHFLTENSQKIIWKFNFSVEKVLCAILVSINTFLYGSSEAKTVNWDIVKK